MLKRRRYPMRYILMDAAERTRANRATVLAYRSFAATSSVRRPENRSVNAVKKSSKSLVLHPIFLLGSMILSACTKGR